MTIKLLSITCPSVTVPPPPTNLDPDVVPISMVLDVSSGVTPLTVNVTLQYKNNTINTISNAKALLWVGITPISFVIPSVVGNEIVSIVVPLQLTGTGSFAIKPEVPDGFPSGYLYGDINFDGIVDTNDILLYTQLLLNNPAPTNAQIAVGDLDRNGIITISDRTIEVNFLNLAAQSVYTPVGRKVVTLPSQTVNVTVPAAPTTGTYIISSTPQGAEIFIDFVDQGIVTPAIIEYGKGTHVVEVRLAGYQNFRENTTLIAGQSITFDAILVPV